MPPLQPTPPLRIDRAPLGNGSCQQCDDVTTDTVLNTCMRATFRDLSSPSARQDSTRFVRNPSVFIHLSPPLFLPLNPMSKASSPERLEIIGQHERSSSVEW